MPSRTTSLFMLHASPKRTSHREPVTATFGDSSLDCIDVHTHVCRVLGSRNTLSPSASAVIQTGTLYMLAGRLPTIFATSLLRNVEARRRAARDARYVNLQTVHLHLLADCCHVNSILQLCQHVRRSLSGTRRSGPMRALQNGDTIQRRTSGKSIDVFWVTAC
jgi:hypothetical protein